MGILTLIGAGLELIGAIVTEGAQYRHATEEQRKENAERSEKAFQRARTLSVDYHGGLKSNNAEADADAANLPPRPTTP